MVAEREATRRQRFAGLERVFEGPDISRSGKGDRSGPVVVILCTRGECGRVSMVELSFRHEEIGRKRICNIALAARRFFNELQSQVWARPEAIGKTEFIYRGGVTAWDRFRGPAIGSAPLLAPLRRLELQI